MALRSRHSTLLALALAGVVLATSPRPAAQQAAAVRGKVDIGIPVATRRATNTYSRTISAPELAPRSEIANVVVFLKDAPARPLTPVRARIRQINESFEPRVVAVPVGSDVDFPNDDPIYHNVFSLSRAKNFDLGRYPRGETRRVHFDKPGVVKVFCQIHSHMSATVMVFDHPWYATPDASGRFELQAVPPGDRQITAWHERLGDTTLSVRIEAGRDLTADFVLPVPQRP